MRGVQSYARQRAESAPPEDVLLLLLEGALDRVRQADEAMEAKDRVLWNKHLHTVRAIFIELTSALDPSLAPEIATNLRNTYSWIIHHSTEAARAGDRGRLAQVRDVVQIVYDTWSQAVQIQRDAGDLPPTDGDGEP
jgi:flagellar protein FliS